MLKEDTLDHSVMRVFGRN